MCDSTVTVGAPLLYADASTSIVLYCMMPIARHSNSVSVPWNADSDQVECSAITIDVENELAWMSDWVKSNYVYKYHLHSVANTFDVGKLHLRGTPEWT